MGDTGTYRVWSEPRVGCASEPSIGHRKRHGIRTKTGSHRRICLSGTDEDSALRQSGTIDWPQVMIFLHDANGIRTLYTILRDLYKLEPLLQMLSRPDCNSVEESLRTNAVQMAAFNDPNNIHGHKHRIMLCSTDDFGEGVSFMEVRHIIVGDTSSKQDVSVKQKKKPFHRRRDTPN